MTSRLLWHWCCLYLIAMVSTNNAQAQVQRDPTLPPPQAFSPLKANSGFSPFGDDAGVAVVVRDGKPFMVSGSRLYGVGENIGAYKITRISETEIWLRNGKEIRKLMRFAGIQRTPLAELKGPKP